MKLCMDSWQIHFQGIEGAKGTDATFIQTWQRIHSWVLMTQSVMLEKIAFWMAGEMAEFTLPQHGWGDSELGEWNLQSLICKGRKTFQEHVQGPIQNRCTSNSHLKHYYNIDIWMVARFYSTLWAANILLESRVSKEQLFKIWCFSFQNSSGVKVLK